MTILEYIHRPNRTELGLSGCHDSYLKLSDEIYHEDMFKINEEEDFFCHQLNRKLKFKARKYNSASNNEYRLTKLSDAISKLSIHCGDELRFIRIKDDNTHIDEAFVDLIPHNDICVFYPANNNKFYLEDRGNILNLTNHRDKIDAVYNGSLEEIRIDDFSNEPIRRDSTISTDCYSIYANGTRISKNIDFILSYDGNQYIFAEEQKWIYRTIKI